MNQFTNLKKHTKQQPFQTDLSTDSTSTSSSTHPTFHRQDLQTLTRLYEESLQIFNSKIQNQSNPDSTTTSTTPNNNNKESFFNIFMKQHEQAPLFTSTSTTTCTTSIRQPILLYNNTNAKPIEGTRLPDDTQPAQASLQLLQQESSTCQEEQDGDDLLQLSKDIKVFYTKDERYEGEMEDGLREGKGVLENLIGDLYMGEWHMDQRWGYGTQKWAQVNKKEHTTQPDSEYYCAIYEGEWRSDRFNGFGKLSRADGSGLQGFFVEGKLEGYGKISFKDGSTYLGEVKMGQMHGEGVRTWPNGKVMDGTWKLNEMHGLGVVTMPDGHLVSGTFSRQKFVSED